MKPILVLTMLVVLASVGLAQEPFTKRSADSVGTANAYWQTIDLKDNFQKIVTFSNLSKTADNLIAVLDAQDTTTTATATRRWTIKARKFVTVLTIQRYVYVKASANTVSYEVLNGRTGDVGNLGTDTTIVKGSITHTAGDTLLTRIAAPYWKSFTATDSITRVRDALQYSANDVMWPDSAASGPNSHFFAFTGVAAANGGRFIITDIQVSGDTIAAGGYMLVFIKDSTSANHIADNAPYVMLGNQFGNRVGEVIGSLQTTGAGTGSNNAWDYQTGVNLQGGTGASSTTVYARWVWTAAYTPAWHGTYRIKIKGLQEVLPQ